VTQEELLLIVKQKVGQAVAVINGEEPTYLDEFLLKYVKTVNFILFSLGIDTELVIDHTAKTITPDPFDDELGLLLAYGVASNLVGDDLVNKLHKGELGLSFTTGVTQITTNQAAITLKTSANALTSQFDLLVAAYLSGDPNAVNERLQ
jgi:hypothetical protein